MALPKLITVSGLTGDYEGGNTLYFLNSPTQYYATNWSWRIEHHNGRWVIINSSDAVFAMSEPCENTVSPANATWGITFPVISIEITGNQFTGIYNWNGWAWVHEENNWFIQWNGFNQRWELYDYLMWELETYTVSETTSDPASIYGASWTHVISSTVVRVYQYPTLTRTCIALSDADEVQAIRASQLTREGDYVQASDIDMSSIANFLPIGNVHGPFLGSYDGQGYKLNNLTINRTTTDMVGLFGSLGAWGSGHLQRLVKNVKIRNCNITGRNNVAPIAGHITGSARVNDCSATGSITGQKRIGGLLGSMVTGHARRCWADVNVTVSGSGHDRIGGFCADVRYGSSVLDCYARGNVNGGDAALVGGFAGNITETPTVLRCYAAGLAAGGSDVGQFTGYEHPDADPTIEHCYWISDDAGSTSVHGQRLSTAQAKDPDNYTGWNFTTRWNIDQTETINDGYPYLDPRRAPQAGYPGLYRSLYRKR